MNNDPFLQQLEAAEEGEDDEDRERHEEELRNLLAHAMGDFDELNISMSSEALDVRPIDDYEQQFRHAAPDDQLRILYEVRTQEVNTLNNNISELKEKYEKESALLINKLSLIELENEQKNISLKEAQELIVEKIEQIELHKFEEARLKNLIKNLNEKITTVNQENQTLQDLNLQLQEQVGILSIDKNFTKHKHDEARILDIKTALNRALEESEIKEKQCGDLMRDFKKRIQEKDDLLASNALIVNKLTENLEESHRRCQELQETIIHLREVQQDTEKNQTRPLEEELKKIREYHEREDVIADNIRKVVTDEFKSQIVKVYEENNVLKESLEKHKKELTETLECLKTATFADQQLKETLAIAEEERLKAIENSKKLLEQSKMFINLQEENNLLKNKLVELELCVNNTAKPSLIDHSIQSSFCVINNTDFENIQKEKEDISMKLRKLELNLIELENKLKIVTNENSQLKFKVELEKERDLLIKNLQEKALQFEKIICELNDKATTSVAVNTSFSNDNDSCLKLKYDTLLFQKEAEIRRELKKEFDAKLATCSSCLNVRNELRTLTESKSQDRDAVARLVDMWMSKFVELEKEMQINGEKLRTAYEEKFILYARELEQKRYAPVILKNGELIKYSLVINNTCSKSLNKIETGIRKYEEDITALEKMYSNKIKDLKTYKLNQ